MDLIDELLDFGPSNRILPALGLNVDSIEPKAILVDNAVAIKKRRIPVFFLEGGHFVQALNNNMLPNVITSVK